MKKMFLFFSVSVLFVACNGNSPKAENEIQKTETITSVTKLNRIEVFCFHGTRQCETCKNMKANTKATLDKYFVNHLKDSSIVFAIVDVDDEKNEKLAEKFQATGTALMINKIVNGKDSIVDWSDFAFEKANNKDEFIIDLKTKLEAIIK